MTLIHHRRGATRGAGALRGAGPQGAGFAPINPLYAALVRVFGPAQCGDNPLAGTKYDAVLAGQRDRERYERRAAKAIPRWQRRNLRAGSPGPQRSSAGSSGTLAAPESGREGTRTPDLSRVKRTL